MLGKIFSLDIKCECKVYECVEVQGVMARTGVGEGNDSKGRMAVKRNGVGGVRAGHGLEL